MEIDGNIVSDPVKIAEHFNDYYLSIADKIGSNSNYSKNLDSHPSYRTIQDHVSENNIPVLNFKTIDLKSVDEIIDKLPTGKAPGYDNIAGHSIKAVKSSINTPLQCMINRMFIESVFPDPLKHADITPIYKKNN